jgi:phage shock protein PspC (stress-responsive transcriptional regulator)
MPKRLYKIAAQKKISGVCAGVAEYFNIDVSIVRILWVAAALCWSIGLWVYLVAVFVLPDKTELPY